MMLHLYVPSVSPFLLLFKIGFNAIIRCCLDIMAYFHCRTRIQIRTQTQDSKSYRYIVLCRTSFHWPALRFGSLFQMSTVPIIGKDLYPNDRSLSLLHFNQGIRVWIWSNGKILPYLSPYLNPSPAIEISHNVKKIKGVAHRNGDVDGRCKQAFSIVGNH